MPVVQGRLGRAYCKIVVDGKDVTNAFDPHLISIQVIESEGTNPSGGSDTCSIELDDRDGRLAIPPIDAPLEVSLGWATLILVFNGKVQEVESTFARRGGGRRLIICGVGIGMGLGRTHMRNSWGDGESADVTLKTVLEQAGKFAGYTVKVSPSMADKARKFWAQNESFHALGARLARELGGAFKVSGDTASFVSLTDMMNTDGDAMPEVVAEWGWNLIAWRIKPFAAAPQGRQAVAPIFDRSKGFWDKLEKAIGGDLPFGGSQNVFGLPAPAPNSQVADQLAEGLRMASIGTRGTGSVVMNGEPNAKAGGKLKVVGARAGVDGNYRIAEAEHNYDRSGGYITQCQLRQPDFDPIVYKKQGWPPNKLTPDEKLKQAIELDAIERTAQAERDAGLANKKAAPK